MDVDVNLQSTSNSIESAFESVDVDVEVQTESIDVDMTLSNPTAYSNIFKAVYETTDFFDIKQAHDDGKIVILEHQYFCYTLTECDSYSCVFSAIYGPDIYVIAANSSGVWRSYSYEFERLSNKITSSETAVTDRTQYYSARVVDEKIEQAQIDNVVVFYAKYNSTTYDEINAQYNLGKKIFCVSNSQKVSFVMPLSSAAGNVFEFFRMYDGYYRRVTCDVDGWKVEYRYFQNKKPFTQVGALNSDNISTGCEVDLTGCDEIELSGTVSFSGSGTNYLSVNGGQTGDVGGYLIGIGSGTKRIVARAENSMEGVTVTYGKSSTSENATGLGTNLTSYSRRDLLVKNITKIFWVAPSNVSTCDIIIYAR